jgi:hypothetical protein
MKKILRIVALPFVVVASLFLSSMAIHLVVWLLWRVVLRPQEDDAILVNGQHPLAAILSQRDAEYLGYSLINPAVLILSVVRWLRIERLRSAMYLCSFMALWCLVAPLVLRSGLLPMQSSDSVLLAILKAVAGVASSVQGGYMAAVSIMRQRNATAPADTASL